MRKYRVDAKVTFNVWAKSEKQARQFFESSMDEIVQAIDETFPEEPCFSDRTSILWEELRAKAIKPDKGEKCPADEDY